MVQITRKQENILLALFTALSLVSLALVLNYSIIPSIPHNEVVPLRLYTDVETMKTSMSKSVPSDHTLGQHEGAEGAVCWLTFLFLVNKGSGATSMFTAYLDLPYGTTGMNYTTAAAPALAFLEKATDATDLVLFINPKDHTAVYFNMTTGSNDRDWSLTWNGSGLKVVKRVGDGIHVGGGFLLVVCIVGFLLPLGLFLLRCWEDRHPVAQSLSEHTDDRTKAREGLAFSPLPDHGPDEDLDPLDEDDARRFRQHDSSSTAIGANHYATRDLSEIELGEMDEEKEMDEERKT